MKKIIILSLLAICLQSSAQEASQFKREKEFDKLQISIDDFKRIVDAIKYYHEQYPIDTLDKYNTASISCEIKKNNESQTFQGFQQISGIELRGESFNELSLDYQFSRQSISDVHITFSHGWRRMSVSGKDKMKVDALFNALDNQLGIGQGILNFDWQLIFSTLATGLFFIAAILLGAKANDSNPANIKFVREVKIASVIYIVACIIFYLSPLKVKNIFPAFELMPDNVKWWDKYGNLISVTVTFGTIIIAIYRYIIRKFSIPTQPAQVNNTTSTEENNVHTIDRDNTNTSDASEENQP